MSDFGERHPATRHFEPLFNSAHLPRDLAQVVELFEGLARNLLDISTVDGPELTVALRKLLEAKDAAVRHLVLNRVQQ